MAVGATADEDLAVRVGRATGRELRALGVNVNYAPVCDLATNPANPALGIRSFGDDPEAASTLVAATVRGLQAEGVAATLKHFPGAGDIASDPHLELASVPEEWTEFASRELVPFQAGIEAGARMVMAGHFALPALTGDPTLPASLARAVINDLLRDELEFDGLAITDALDMHALAQGAAQIVNAICALRAGEDLLLGTVDPELLQRLEDGLTQAEKRGLTEAQAREVSAARLGQVRAWFNEFPQPALEVVGSSEHQALAAELARRSLTLVRNDDALLPLRPSADVRIAVVQPRPADRTPADTSSQVSPLLAEAVRRRHAATDSFVVEPAASEGDAAELRAQLTGYGLIILGTVSANLVPEQASLARTILALGRPTVTVALRTPWDICAYPEARTHVCSYGILGPTVEALAGALFGESGFPGRLPVDVSREFPRGHGLDA
jgi:beta-N-acetylhexosaminidase